MCAGARWIVPARRNPFSRTRAVNTGRRPWSSGHRASYSATCDAGRGGASFRTRTRSNPVRGAAVNYPLDVGGVDDYPIKVGSMLLTLVDPNRGFERAYNRWYERDHYYA